MYYRVDYVLGVMLAGFLVGAMLKFVFSRVEPARIARAYLYFVAAMLAVRAFLFVWGVIDPQIAAITTSTQLLGDLNNFAFGALFGIALFRDDRRTLLSDQSVFSALCLATGIGYVIAGYTKAFYMQSMTDFFSQSGYSLTFLKFIMTIEVLGGVAMLIPSTVLPAVVGLAIDMFGAFWTHVHNGDPLNDSTGAIASLVRLAAIACLWAWRPRPSDTRRSAGRRLIGVAAIGLSCFVFAVVGSREMRRPATQALVRAPQAKPAVHPRQQPKPAKTAPPRAS